MFRNIGSQTSKFHHSVPLKKEQYDILLNVYDSMIDTDKRSSHFIYVRVDPEIAFQRAIKRGRPEERNLPLSYFTDLHSLMDEWLLGSNSSKTTVVDGLKDAELLYNDVLSAINSITF
ncbi:thymidine kinase 2, mitochondrial-like [Frankliniella occidentalis]|uniref:Thymidine kinase 2, mitochondrial-like n=1 Tax=Frankliniella occidentalis TaxID=133901 RepID=A0A9C6U425_FRAOC|nr:thymidine kinase 2, mitochondrial-like [Frankliniella occidentalis]